MFRVCWSVPMGACLLVSAFQPVWADTTTELKPRSVGLELYSQDQDVQVTGFTIQNPLLAAMVPASAKDMVKVKNNLQTAGVKLDYQATPNLNVFGGLAQVTGDASAKLSAIPGLGLPDMKFDADGLLYNMGATLSGRNDRYFGALTYVHSIADTHGGVEGGTVDTVLPMAGVLTKVGAFNLGLLYQQADINYAGTVDLPGFGQVAATVDGESADKFAYRAGYQTQLGKDVYVDVSAGFGGWQEARLELSKRF